MEDKPLYITNNELIEMLKRRADRLKDAEFHLDIETETKLSSVQVVLDEFKRRFEDYREKHKNEYTGKKIKR